MTTSLRQSGQFVALTLLLVSPLSLLWAEPPPAAPNAPVELPPLEVEERVAAHPWSYAESSGFEVLSRCSDSTTRDFLEAQNRAAQLFKLLVPESLQFRPLAPTIIVLSNRMSAPSTAQELMASSLSATPSSTHEDLRGLRLPPSNPIRFMPNLRLADVDAFAVYAIIDESTFEAEHLEMAREHVFYLLTQRAPPLPGWFVTGVMGLFDSVQFEPAAVAITPANWISTEESAKLREDPSALRNLLPLVDFLGERPTGTSEEATEFNRIWRAQATLFVRWALDPKNGARRDALWTFVSRSAGAIPSEDVFRSCFGFGYAEMRDRLSDYLPIALRNSFHLRPDRKISFASPKIRAATPAEIGRIRGEWERLEAIEVREHHPQFAARYVDQVARTLQLIYSRGERDARFLAVKGLFECDQGRDAEAKPLLEAALAAKVVRPRVYFELARIRFSITGLPLIKAQKLLDPQDVKSILEPLKIGITQAPPLEANYRLVVDVWNHSAVKLSPDDLAWFEQGLRLFPRDVTLLYEGAVIAAYRGKKAEAESLVTRALRLVKDEEMRERLEKLQVKLNSAPTPQAQLKAGP